MRVPTICFSLLLFCGLGTNNGCADQVFKTIIGADADTTQTTVSSKTLEQPSQSPCGTYKGHTLYRGPKGGCYYESDKGTKVYVDHGYCNC